VQRFTDQSVVVTGAVGGIGGATCHRLADEGAHLVVTDVDAADCAAFVETLPHPERHRTFELDVTSEESWADLAGSALVADRAPAALVNNAGIGSLLPVDSEERETWERVVAVNQTGVWLGMKHLGPRLRRTGRGASIVNVCSILGTVGGTGEHIAYHATKGAVRTMTKSAALHWVRDGVRVNSVHPGYVATPNLLKRHGHTPAYQTMLTSSPMGRLAEPEEVAAAIAFLASDDSSYVTGSELYVDGGYTAH
jgi:3alpha(or 20beta)-hydroxysteroid dehydrogenase